MVRASSVSIVTLLQNYLAIILASLESREELIQGAYISVVGV
jgi:hypothetical protein